MQLVANNLLEFFLFKKFCLITQCEKSGVNRILWFFLSHKFSKEWGGQQSNSKEWQALSPETCEAGWPSAAWGFALRGYFAELQSSEKGCAVCVCCHKQHDGSVPRRPESGPGTLLRSAWLWESHREGHLLLHPQSLSRQVSGSLECNGRGKYAWTL